MFTRGIPVGVKVTSTAVKISQIVCLTQQFVHRLFFFCLNQPTYNGLVANVTQLWRGSMSGLGVTFRSVWPLTLNKHNAHVPGA